MLCPTNRVLVTDGNLLYNCSEFKKLRGNDIKTELPEVAVIGVIGGRKEVTIPSYFCGKKVKLIYSLNVYEKGENFPEIIDDFVFIPSTIKADVSFYYPCERLIPNSDYLVNTNKTTAEEVAFDGIAFEKDVFCGNRNLKSITLGIGKIPTESFINCENLNFVKLTDKCRVIGKKAFSGCKNLQLIILPDSIRKILSEAFALTDIQLIVIPPSVEEILPYTFGKCKNLGMVFIPPSVINISKSAFYDVNPDMIIAGQKGSYAEMYAKKHKINFMPFDNIVIEQAVEDLNLYKSEEI